MVYQQKVEMCEYLRFDGKFVTEEHCVHNIVLLNELRRVTCICGKCNTNTSNDEVRKSFL